MRPTQEQIATASYHRWMRRDGRHGADREDWAAAEKDLIFGLNYRYIARHALGGGPVLLGKAEAEAAGRRRRCRFCEQGEPSASFGPPRPALPSFVGNTALLAWDECDDCRAHDEGHLAPAFEAFARPMLGDSPVLPREGARVPAPALKAMVRMALSIMPGDELPYFGDTIEWVANPDHARDAGLLDDLGCLVYLTPAPVPAPFVALARREDDDAAWPSMLFFLGTSRVVFQTPLPLCPRDEDRDDLGLRGPELSMTLGTGLDLHASLCVSLAVESAGPSPWVEHGDRAVLGRAATTPPGAADGTRARS